MPTYEVTLETMDGERRTTVVETRAEPSKRKFIGLLKREIRGYHVHSWRKV